MFSYFPVQDVSRAGFFWGFSPWLVEGCLLCFFTWSSTHICVLISSLCFSDIYTHEVYFSFENEHSFSVTTLPIYLGNIYFIVLFFYWSIIALQCVSFCCTMKWISYMYTYIPSLLDFPPNLGHHRALSRVPCAIQYYF